MNSLEGAFTALITPFLEDGSLDLVGWKRNIELQIEAGIDGLVILGTTGESATITDTERKYLIRSAAEIAKDKCVLLVGTGSPSTQTAMTWTAQAKELGADGALVVTPYYNKPTQEGLFQHFSAICNTTPHFPICLYNVPGRTSVNLLPSTVARLATIPQIMAIKESSGQLSQIEEVLTLIRQVSPHLSLLSGDDALTLPVMLLGGKGIISVVSNLFPQAVVSLVREIKCGNLEKARMWHNKLLPYVQAAFYETNPIPIKWAMNHLNLAAGPCRLPLTPLSQKYQESWTQLLATPLIPYGSTQSSSC